MDARGIKALFEQLELYLISSMRRNLSRHLAEEKKEGFAWPQWQAEQLRGIKQWRMRTRAAGAKYESQINAETEKLLQEQYDEGSSHMAGVNPDKLEALMHEMQRRNSTVTQAATRYTEDQYRRIIHKASLFHATGSVGLPQAVDMATKDFLQQGIRSIVYADGRRVNIADYAEMALRTAATRSQLLGEAKRRESLGIDTVLVSQYGACSPTCLPWQGRVYIDDVYGEAPAVRSTRTGISKNGKPYPLLSMAINGGLFHPNCRHTMTTWIEGVNSVPPPLDEERVERTYKLEQKQRAMEREVRRLKRLAVGTLDPKSAKTYMQKARQAQKALRAFVLQNGDVLRRDVWRERQDDTGEAAFAAPGGQEAYGYAVTADSINAVQTLDSTLLDDKGKEWLRDRSKHLLLTVQPEPLATERGECYALADKRPLFAQTGPPGGGEVGMPDQQEPYIMLHNHPNNFIFSASDIDNFLKHDKLLIMVAIGNKGTGYKLEKTESFDGTSLEKLFFDSQMSFPKWRQNPVEHIQMITKFAKEAGQFGLAFSAK